MGPVTGVPEHAKRAQQAFDWFLGRNRLHRPLYDFATGGCSDGLGAQELNRNEGAIKMNRTLTLVGLGIFNCDRFARVKNIKSVRTIQQ